MVSPSSNTWITEAQYTRIRPKCCWGLKNIFVSQPTSQLRCLALFTFLKLEAGLQYLHAIYVCEAVPRLRRLVAGLSPRRPGVRSQVKSMWDLRWTKWHWDRFFSELSIFPCRFHSTGAPLIVKIGKKKLLIFIIIGVAQKALRLWCEGPSSRGKKSTCVYPLLTSGTGDRFSQCSTRILCYRMQPYARTL
jgi:hypothetical protein